MASVGQTRGTTTIKVPPLRVRPSDVDALAAHYLRSFCRKKGRQPLRLTPSALRRLERWARPAGVPGAPLLRLSAQPASCALTLPGPAPAPAPTQLSLEQQRARAAQRGGARGAAVLPQRRGDRGGAVLVWQQDGVGALKGGALTHLPTPQHAAPQPHHQPWVGSVPRLLAQAQDVMHIDLLTQFPQLREFLRSEWWTERINYG